ncbi:hypothetical protein R6Z07F_012131 [Ovis aries]
MAPGGASRALMKGLNCHRGRNPVCDISAHDPGPELDTYTLCLTDSQLYPHGETEETGKQDHWPQDNKKRTEPKPRAKEAWAGEPHTSLLMTMRAVHLCHAQFLPSHSRSPTLCEKLRSKAVNDFPSRKAKNLTKFLLATKLGF